MKKIPFRRTTRGRLLFLAIGVEMLMLLILVSNSMRLMNDIMSNQTHIQVEEYTPVLLAALTAPLAQRDYSTVQAILNESRKSGGVSYIVIEDRSGKRVASNGWPFDKPLPAPQKELHLFENKMRYDVALPILLENQSFGTLHYGFDMSHIIAGRRVLLIQGFGIAALEVVLSTLVLLLVGHWMTRSLTKLINASLQIADGNLSPPEMPEGKDDLGQLGVAFNSMALVISERMSELTVAKEAAETSEKRLRSISDSAIDAILMMDPRGVISYWNSAAVRILGYSPEEAIGKDLHDLLVPKHYHAAFYAAFPEFLRSGTGNALGKTLERFAIRKDGQEIEVALSLSPALLDGEWHAVGMLRDITKTKSMERTLRKLSSAVQHSPASIVITDYDGTIEYVNPKFCEITGFTSEEVIGQNPRITKGGNHPQSFYKDLWTTIKSGREWRGELHNRNKDGSFIWELTSISPIWDESGVVTHFVGVKENITAQKELQEKLIIVAENNKLAKIEAEQANKTKSEFLASMSHELRTPINAMLGMTDLLVEPELSHEQTEYFTVLRSAGEALQGLINNILDLSKIEAGMLSLESAPFKVSDCIQQIMGMMIGQANQKNINITSSLSVDIPDWLLGDSLRVIQILLNLVSNAIKFTEQGSLSLLVELVSVSGSEVMLKFSVIDTGIGIAPDKLKTIFEKFCQADTSTTRNYGGSGLGLAISQHLAQMMGGNIDVESALGQGSCFYFTCRFTTPTVKPVEFMQEINGTDKPIRSLSILLVDDNKDNRTVMCAYFRKTDHVVATAVNGEEAFAKIKEGNFDLVLLDMEMPVMDGYTAVRLIRQWELETGRSELPVIALTANALKEDRQKSLDAGCTEHLTKPIHKTRLLEVVDAYAVLS